MSIRDPESVWSDYHAGKKSQRLGEAEVLWSLMEKNGVTEATVLAIDFVHFAPSRAGADALADQLREHYTMEVRPASEDGYWYVTGTTRPYGLNLSRADHAGWVEFMSDVARSHACVFSTWSIEAPALKQWFRSEDIESAG
ncbi:MAG: hypothetical protein ACOY33_10430 [Pseudomonadota bacterium]